MKKDVTQIELIKEAGGLADALKPPLPIAVFVSGVGSNFEALLKHPLHGVRYQIVLLVSDQPACAGVQKAKNYRIPCFTFSAKAYSSKSDYETAILEALRESKVQLIVLAGFMRLIGQVLLQAFPKRIINVHPSLLPAFAGKHAIEQALHAGVPSTGVTVHYVDEGMDTGMIIRQQEIPIFPEDTSETLHLRIQAIEHEILADAVCLLVEEIQLLDQEENK